jgi:hypothetical protein
VEPIILPIVDDPALPTFDKLQRFFDTTARSKTARKAYVLSILQVWYTDDNAIVREKATANMIKQIAPLLARVIRQGVQEGVLATPFPEQAAEIVLVILTNLGNAFKDLFFEDETQAEKMRRATGVVAAHNDAMERVLGALTGSLNLVDADTLNEWFVVDDDKA